MESWVTGIGAISLFMEDLDAAKDFYGRAFGSPVIFEDDNSVVYRFGGTLINLLHVSAVPELIEPAQLAPREAGARLELTLHVEDVDALCAQLAANGVELLNGPMDRPWGPRTACFRDPGGHIWEIAN